MSDPIAPCRRRCPSTPGEPRGHRTTPPQEARRALRAGDEPRWAEVARLLETDPTGPWSRQVWFSAGDALPRLRRLVDALSGVAERTAAARQLLAVVGGDTLPVLGGLPDGRSAPRSDPCSRTRGPARSPRRPGLRHRVRRASRRRPAPRRRVAARPGDPVHPEDEHVPDGPRRPRRPLRAWQGEALVEIVVGDHTSWLDGAGVVALVNDLAAPHGMRFVELPDAEGGGAVLAAPADAVARAIAAGLLPAGS